MREDTKASASHFEDPITEQVNSEYVELAAEVFSLLADPTRIRIILALRQAELPNRELSVNHLAEIVDKSPTAVSQHLAKLRWARVVQPRHEGNRVFYSLADEHAQHLVAEAILQAQHAVDDEPEHHRRTLRPLKRAGS